MVNEKPLVSNISIGKITKTNIDETYSYRGVHSNAINKYVGAKISIGNSIPFQLEVKVFNDGVAFRYLVNNKDLLMIWLFRTLDNVLQIIMYASF